MIPSKLDLVIWRGTSFELELVSQVKNYTFDPALHTGAADLKRTHAENLEFYGFTYDYVDFATNYTSATLEVLKPWRQNSKEERTALLSLSLATGEIAFTDKSIQIGIDPDATQEIDFDSGSYKLQLTTASGHVDGLIYGTITVEGEK